MKTLNLSIVCVTLLLGFWIWSASHKSPWSQTRVMGETIPAAPAVNVDAIKALLAKDKELSDQRDQALNQINVQSDQDFDQMVTILNNYIQQGQAIPLSDCPGDLAEAYTRHMGAWTDLANTINGHPHVEGGVENFTKNFIRGMSFDLQGPERDQKEWTDYRQKVNDSMGRLTQSWTDVEALAVRYGAK